jgi:SAM-dependent methyltransferase
MGLISTLKHPSPMFRIKCMVCESTSLFELLDLGMHPFADTFIPVARESDPDKLYPLVVDMCGRCNHIQLRAVTSPEDRYGEFDYSYTSSNSATARRHWDAYPHEVLASIRHPVESVLEIGSNDGYLARQFMELDLEVVGYDASPAMTKLAKERGVNAVCGIFDGTSEPAGVFDLVVANNVFNHADDPISFVEGVMNALTVKGTFVFELPYWYRSVLSGQFDQIYHEHVSYFTVTGAVKLFRQFANFRVYHVEEVDYHGGSIRVFVGNHRADSTVTDFMEMEALRDLFNPEMYQRWMRDIREARRRFLGVLPSGDIVCVGAAAKANTFLNYYGLGHGLVRYVTDASEFKIGKLTPGTRIPIMPDDILREGDPTVIITSWNLATVLKPKLRQLNPHLNFLTPSLR